MKNVATEMMLVGMVFSLLLSAAAQSNSPGTKPKRCSVESGDNRGYYPDSLKGSGIEGTVVLEAIIGTDGCVSTATIAHKLNPELDKAAKQTIESWKFKPATMDGKKVMVRVKITVDFKDTGKSSN